MREGGGSGFRGFGSVGEQRTTTFGKELGTAVGGGWGRGWGRGEGSSSSDASVGFGKDNPSARMNANSGFGFDNSQSTSINNSAGGSDLSSAGFGGGNRPSGFKSIGAEFSKASHAGFGKAVSNGGVGGNVPTFGFSSFSSFRGDGSNNTAQLSSGTTTTSSEFGASSFSDTGGKRDNAATSISSHGGFGVTPRLTATAKDFGLPLTQTKQGGFGGGTEPLSSIADDANNGSAALKGFTGTALRTNVGTSGLGMTSTDSKGFPNAAGFNQGVNGGGSGTSGQQPTFGTMGSGNRFGARKTFGTVAAYNEIAQQSSIASPVSSFGGAATGAPISGNSKKPDISLRGDESDKRAMATIHDVPPLPVADKDNLELNKPQPRSTRIMGMTTSEADAMKAAIQRIPRAEFLGSGDGGNGGDLKSKMYEKMTNSLEQSKVNISKGIVGGGADELASTRSTLVAAPEEGVSTIDGVQVEWERRDFADAVALIGRNELMCSSKEVEERIRMDDLRMLEREHVNHCKPDGTPYRTHEMAIKKFKRVTPGTRKDDPAEVRTPKALEMTMSYLEDEVIPKGTSYIWGGEENDPRIEDSVARMKWGEENASDEVGYEVYKYVWDRTREIRGDYSMQGFQMAVGRLDSVMDLSVFERIVRWHICMDHRLHGNVAYDRGNNAAQNLEQLKASLGSLLELYCVARSKISAGGNPKDFTSPHEAELCAYHLLLNLDLDGGSMALSLVQEWIDNAPQVAQSIWVKRALKILVARKNGDFSFFFRELSTAPYLFRCCLFMYVSSERSEALRCLQAMRTYPLDDLVDLLAFQSRDEAMDFVTAHGLEVDVNNDVCWFNSKGDRMLVTPARLPVVLKMEATIESASRGFGIKDIIHGKALPTDGTWGRALYPRGKNDTSATVDSQSCEERAMQARVIEIIKRNEEDRQKRKDEEETRLVELKRIKRRADAERETREAQERAKKALQDAEKRRLEALRLQEEEKERLLVLERQAKKKRDAEAKYLLEQKRLAEEKARREARLLEEARLAEEAEKNRQEEERRRKELEEKEIKEAEERRRRREEEEERLRKEEERRREAEHRARISAENSRRLKLATTFCSQRMLSFGMSAWHARAEETTNLWRLELNRRKRNRDSIASTDISLTGQPLLKRVLASGDFIVRQRSVATQPQLEPFAVPSLGHDEFCHHDGGEKINDRNVMAPSPHLKIISPELSALAISRSLPSRHPSEPAQLFRILVIHSESAPSWLIKWLEGCLGIRGERNKRKNGAVMGEVMSALSSCGGNVYICARSISMQYNDDKATRSSLVEEHSAVASAVVFVLSGLDSVLPMAVESLSHAMDILPKGIPIALLLANERKLQHHQMHEGGFLSSHSSNSTALKIVRPHKIWNVKKGNEHELLNVLEFLAVNVPSFMNPIVVGHPLQDILEHCINRVLWHSSSPSSSFSSTSTSTNELLTAVKCATAGLAKLFQEHSTSILSRWPPDEFVSDEEERNGNRVIKNGALLMCSGPIGEPSLRVGDVPVSWRDKSVRAFEKAMEALTLQGVSGTTYIDNDMLQLDRVTSADEQSRIELPSKFRTTDSSTLLALEYKLRAIIQDVLGESDLVYSSPFEINWWFEEDDKQQREKNVVKGGTQENRTAASSILLKNEKVEGASVNNNVPGIVSLDGVPQPPCPSTLDTSPANVTTLQLCATTLRKQQAALRGHLGNALLKHIRSVSRDTQRLAGILQKHIRGCSSDVSVTSDDNISTISGRGCGDASPVVVRDVGLMVNDIRKERKASENTEKRLQAAVGVWKARPF